MLVDDIGDVTITNDGAIILKQLEIEHPARANEVQAAVALMQYCTQRGIAHGTRTVDHY
jgi:chaperonin GroEL (HSP60 family)